LAGPLAGPGLPLLPQLLHRGHLHAQGIQGQTTGLGGVEQLEALVGRPQPFRLGDVAVEVEVCAGDRLRLVEQLANAAADAARSGAAAVVGLAMGLGRTLARFWPILVLSPLIA
jgi:hypothetical protein